MIKRTLLLLLLFVLIAPVCWGGTYYYICPTTMTNNVNDPARKFVNVYYPEKSYCKIFFGDKKAVIAVMAAYPAVGTAGTEVTEKTSGELKAITDIALVGKGFIANTFVISPITGEVTP